MVKFWSDDPHVLLDDPFALWPDTNDRTENLNRVSKIIVYSMVLSYALKRDTRSLYYALMALAVVVFIYYSEPEESFESGALRPPTLSNPMMNVPIPDYDIPQKFKGPEISNSDVVAPTPETRKVSDEIKDKLKEGDTKDALWLFQDANGRLFERNNSQRQFYTAPVDTVPDKQSEFAQWLYGNKYVCKSGSIWDRYGVKYTDDSLMCNGFNASEPTNLGALE